MRVDLRRTTRRKNYSWWALDDVLFVSFHLSRCNWKQDPSPFPFTIVFSLASGEHPAEDRFAWVLPPVDHVFCASWSWTREKKHAGSRLLLITAGVVCHECTTAPYCTKRTLVRKLYTTCKCIEKRRWEITVIRQCQPLKTLTICAGRVLRGNQLPTCTKTWFFLHDLFSAGSHLTITTTTTTTTTKNEISHPPNHKKMKLTIASRFHHRVAVVAQVWFSRDIILCRVRLSGWFGLVGPGCRLNGLHRNTRFDS